MDATLPTPPGSDDANQAPPEDPSATPSDAQRDAGDAGGDAVARKKPVDEKKRARDRLQARLRRAGQAVKNAKSVEELQKLEATLGAGGEAPATSHGNAAAGDLVKAPTAEVLEPGQLPGWPKPSDVEAQKPFARHLWNEAGTMLAATRYGQCLQPQPAEVEMRDGTPVVTKWQDPKQTLTDATAPLLAEWLGQMAALSPTSAALVAVAAVFGPTAVKHGVELVAGLFKRPSPAGVAIQ